MDMGMIMSFVDEYRDELCRRVEDYYRRLNESDGFDVDEIRAPIGAIPLISSYDKASRITSKDEQNMDMGLIMRLVDEYRDELCRGVEDYWSRLNESDGFDVDGIRTPIGAIPLISSCDRVPVLVKLYARAGLHHFNMLEGTNFKLACVMKFNKLVNFLSPYFITLLAQDSVSRSQQVFQVRVDEHQIGCLNLTVLIARPKAVSTNVSTNVSVKARQSISMDKLPEWPSDFNDGKRFYLVKESELRDNDWISLYLELVLLSYDRLRISDNHLSKLKIVKAVIETKEDMTANERLNAKNAVVYITFKGMARAYVVGENDERKALVRSIFHEHTGHLSLSGDLIGEDEFENDFDPASYFKSPAYIARLRDINRNEELLPFMRNPFMCGNKDGEDKAAKFEDMEYKPGHLQGGLKDTVSKFEEEKETTKKEDDKTDHLQGTSDSYLHCGSKDGKEDDKAAKLRRTTRGKARSCQT